MADKTIQCEAYWFFHHKKNPLLEDTKRPYSVDLCNLSENQRDELMKINIRARQNPNKPEKGWHITIKSGKPIELLDEAGNKLSEDTVIGNGSTITAEIYAWDVRPYMKGKLKADETGFAPGLSKAQVIVNSIKEPVNMAKAEEIIL